MRWPAYLWRITIFLPRLRQCSAARHDGELLRSALLVGVGTAILALTAHLWYHYPWPWMVTRPKH